MGGKIFLTLLIIMMIIFFMDFSALAVPDLINFQGKLTDTNGPVDGNYTISFNLYNVSTGGTAIWGEEQTIRVIEGIYNVQLGLVEELSLDLFDTDEIYLEVAIYDAIAKMYETLSPRQRLTSVAFSMKTGDADTVDGKHANEFLSTSNDTQIKSGGLNITGSVGIGTTSPTETLEVNGNIKLSGPYAATLGNDIYPFDMYWAYSDDGTGYGPAWIHTNSRTGNTYPTMWLRTWGDGATLHLDHGLEIGDMTLSYLGAHPSITTRVKISGNTDADSYFNTGGNVGIGVTYPAYALDVRGVMRGTGGVIAGEDSLSLDILIPDAITSTSGKIYLGKHDISDFGDIMVGIGTENPLGVLHIEGPRASHILIGRNNVGGRIIYTDDDGNLNFKPRIDGGVVCIRDGNTNKGIWLYGGGMNQIQSVDLDGTSPFHLSINPSGGNVGIGTTNPRYKLHVVHPQLGVYSRATDTDDVQNYGGYFVADGTCGVGVYAEATGKGLIIVNGGSSCSSIAVYGNASNPEGISCIGGLFTAENGTGVRGTGHIGVYGGSDSGVGVSGYTGGSGGRSVQGIAWGEYGKAVVGYAKYTGDTINYGGLFSAEGTNGRGVRSWGKQFDFYATGPGTNYAPFTGSHEVKLSDNFSNDPKPGMIVSVTGETKIRMREDSSLSISSAMPTVKLSNVKNDKKVLGVFVSEAPLSEDHWYQKKDCERFAVVNALGEGRAWVSDINGDIQAGDYITTSSIPGYGQKQDDDLLHSYTLGKAIETVDWDSVTETIKLNSKIHKIYLIAVVYTSG